MRYALQMGRNWTPTMGVRSVYSLLQLTSPSLAVWEGLGVDKGQCSAVEAPNQTSRSPLCESPGPVCPC